MATPPRATFPQTVHCRPTSTETRTLTPIQRGTATEIRNKNRRDFVSLLASSALIIGVMIIIWVITGAGSFWPIWVIFGLGVVLLGSGWRASANPTEPPDRALVGQRALRGSIRVPDDLP